MEGYANNNKEQIFEIEPVEKNKIVSFPCGKTYDFARLTLVHAHAVNRTSRYPKKPSEYVMLRDKGKSGGVSKCLYRVVKAVKMNPDADFPEGVMLSDSERKRISSYISYRQEKLKKAFEHDDPYRFYLLEEYCKLEPPYIISPNTVADFFK